MMRDVVIVIFTVFPRMPLLLEQVEWILKMSPRLGKQYLQ